ncbi:MAG: PorT family protein [Cyclobacteriaceae bacterium]|nr:PorT family protein [Cyclobacteriaceae bacterium]
MRGLLVLVLFFSSFTSNAQLEFSLGVKGGINYMSLTGNTPLIKHDFRKDYHLGVFLLAKTKVLGIQPELIYSRQGASSSSIYGNFDIQYDYLNVPVIFKLYLIKGLNFQLGPQLSLLVGASGPVGNPQTGYFTAQSVYERINKVDVSIVGGFGWDFLNRFSLETRFNLGLTKTNDKSTNEEKNQVVQISAGCKLFKFGK